MKKTIFMSLLLVIFMLNSLALFHGNELKKTSENFINVNDKVNILNLSDDNSNYVQKRKHMIGLGAAGIPIFIIGFGLEFAGGFLIGYTYAMEPTWNYQETYLGISIPNSWYNIKWVGVGLVAGGSFMFIGGLAMTISGFVLARYYKNKIEKVSLIFDYNYYKNEYKCGFIIKF